MAAVIDNSEPEYLTQQRWDDVDPSATNYRNPPGSRGATWSRIRLREDWWQFDERGELRTQDGWTRFDHRAFNVSNSLFEPARGTDFGDLDIRVVAKLLPALQVLGNVVQLLEARDGVVRFKYWGPAVHRIGIEAYARGLIQESYPELDRLTFDAARVKDHLDA